MSIRNFCAARATDLHVCYTASQQYTTTLCYASSLTSTCAYTPSTTRVLSVSKFELQKRSTSTKERAFRFGGYSRVANAGTYQFVPKLRLYCQSSAPILSASSSHHLWASRIRITRGLLGNICTQHLNVDIPRWYSRHTAVPILRLSVGLDSRAGSQQA